MKDISPIFKMILVITDQIKNEQQREAIKELALNNSDEDQKEIILKHFPNL